MQVGTLHVPGLAFDASSQVHYLKYVNAGKLRPGARESIEQEYIVIAKSIVRAYVEHAKLGTNSGRLLIGAYGATNFVGALSAPDKLTVRKIIAQTLVDVLVSNAIPLKKAGVKDLRAGILLQNTFGLNLKYRSELQEKLNKAGLGFNNSNEPKVSLNAGEGWPKVPNHSKAGDFNVNAWDPNSNVGNGNAKDNSLDGIHGRYSTAAFDIHTSDALTNSESYLTVDSKDC